MLNSPRRVELLGFAVLFPGTLGLRLGALGKHPK